MADYDDSWAARSSDNIDESGNRTFTNSIYGDGETLKISELNNDSDEEEQYRENDDNDDGKPASKTGNWQSVCRLSPRIGYQVHGL